MEYNRQEVLSQEAAMKKCRITAMCRTQYPDLMAQYENPIEHACGVKLGQTWIANGWEKPAGLYAVYYYKGSYDSLKNEAYALFLKEIAQHGYQLSGDLYEDDLIDHFSTPDPAHYILKISARVTPCEGETR